MTLIDNFTKIYGQTCVDEIYEYMVENDLLTEFYKIKNKPKKLFNFGIKYGIIEIVKYLYEHLNIEYDHNIILGFDTQLKSNIHQNTLINAQPILTGSSNDKLRIEVIDKFTKNRKICIKYLIDMKKYSKFRCSKCVFYYKFDVKYNDIL